MAKMKTVVSIKGNKNAPISMSIDAKINPALFDKKELGQMINDSLVVGALLIVNTWKRNTPWITGTYRKSIHVAGHVELTPEFEGTQLSVPTDPLEVKFGTHILDPPYPSYLEYGTSRMKAHPIMWPAVSASRAAAVREVGKALRILLEKAAK